MLYNIRYHIVSYYLSITSIRTSSHYVIIKKYNYIQCIDHVYQIIKLKDLKDTEAYIICMLVLMVYYIHIHIIYVII